MLSAFTGRLKIMKTPFHRVGRLNVVFRSVMILLLFLVGTMVLAQHGGHGGAGKPGGPSKSAGPGGPAGPMGMPTKTIVVLGKVEMVTPIIGRKYTGVFEPIEKVMSIARVTGKVTKIAFQEGQMVKKGDLLFEIEDADWLANVEAAQASVDSAQAAIQQFEAKIKEIDATIRYRQKSFQRNKDLYAQNSAVSLDDMESTESSLETAQAQRLGAEASLKEAKAALRTAQANLALKQLDLDRTKIYSEITGKTGRLAYTLGNYVTPSSTPLIVVAQMDPIYIRFAVSEKDFTEYFERVSKEKEKDFIQVTLSNGKVYDKRAKFSFYDNSIDTATDQIIVWGIIDNPTGILNPGGIAKVTVQTKGTEPLPAVPISAIVHDARGQFVYVVDAEGIARQRRIIIGPEFDNYQCVTGGLKEGETIVIDGTHKIMDGLAVENDTFDKQPEGAQPGGMPSGGPQSGPAPAGTPDAAPAAPAVPDAAPGNAPRRASGPHPTGK